MPMSRLACTSLFRHSACTVFPTGVRLSRRPVERWDAVAIANEGPVLARECFTDHVNATPMFDDIDVWCTSLGQQDYLDATPPRQLVHDLAALSCDRGLTFTSRARSAATSSSRNYGRVDKYTGFIPASTFCMCYICMQQACTTAHQRWLPARQCSPRRRRWTACRLRGKARLMHTIPCA